VPPAAENAPRQKLERPPGERYLRRPTSERSSGEDGQGKPEAAAGKPEAAAAGDPEVAAAPGRGIAYGVVVSIVGALLIAILAGELAVTSGLIVVAAAVGWFVPRSIRLGARGSLTANQARIGAALIAVGGVVLGQVGIWLIARSEGGVLGITDYLGEVFGPLVPIELGVAALVAWLTAR
jgi:hypothetical protein